MIAKWNFKKNVTKEHYMHIARKDKEFQKSDPKKRTRFTLRGQVVKRAKIDRFTAENPGFKPRRCYESAEIAKS